MPSTLNYGRQTIAELEINPPCRKNRCVTYVTYRHIINEDGGHIFMIL